MQTVVVSADVPEDLVHSMTTIIYDKIDTLRSWIATAKGLYAEDFIRFTCPLHPGALKYYKEKGYKIPANLIPPEMK
jgi:TRAP-type uncharacterized transport system substrate-binding protein